MSSEKVSFGPRTVVSVGVDLIEIERIEAAMTRRPRFADRVYTPGEKEFCESKIRPWKHWATRFAAKEAVMKALGVGPGQAGWREIEIAGSARPTVILSGNAAERARELGITRIEISLSHSREHAIAIAAAMSI